MITYYQRDATFYMNEHTGSIATLEVWEMSYQERDIELKETSWDEWKEGLTELETRSECELYKLYDDMLDDCYSIIKIGSLEYYPSYVLEKCDPIAYRCGFSDWVDAEGFDINNEIELYFREA